MIATTKAEGLVAEGFGARLEETELDVFLNAFDRECVSDFVSQISNEQSYDCTTTFAFSDIVPFARNGFEAIVHDSFTQCFEGHPKTRWNQTWYLALAYYCGVFIRYCILFPLRVTVLILAMTIFINLFLISRLFPATIQRRIGRFAMGIVNNAFCQCTLLTGFAFTAVIHKHGNIPAREPGQIYVANHTTVLDIVIMLSHQVYGLTGQGHGGVIGFFQKYVLNFGTDNLWFDRMESRDRTTVAQKIKQHAADTSKAPLLVFPEGTCVNNEFVVMFKRGAFDLGRVIVPVAIKYNNNITDAFWNSKKTSFPMHLFHFMTSWALIADVYYLDPQTRREGETSVQFAARVKEMMANVAGLKSVPWDGYYKYFKPKPEYKRRRQQVFTDQLIRRFNLTPSGTPTTSRSPQGSFSLGKLSNKDQLKPDEALPDLNDEARAVLRLRQQARSSLGKPALGLHEATKSRITEPRRRAISETA
ncbi:uncharacterized protein MONBRDRAFT_29885 [Monosiga brevicollis MX1]|uniref:Phospholipid/glycerol acyltransferase domain-containing protein n=1 Tax=Monosiga brevicollis TaxID=81824 RepID=A9VCF0_MONBE|nr:uncharacterized protein MONBRDRAFT_29885 [Monosiga brevicollis MX1]EDQ84773.1 predicted protein [Monosiga brevicollis MX1]|eukprot:XP_001750423.1 hypothetical protein [Monosiga brevicollis MX1]